MVKKEIVVKKRAREENRIVARALFLLLFLSRGTKERKSKKGVQGDTGNLESYATEGVWYSCRSGKFELCRSPRVEAMRKGIKKKERRSMS